MMVCEGECIHNEDHDNEIEALQVQLDAANTKAFLMQDVLNFFISTPNTPQAHKEMARDVLMKTPAQSLDDVRAKAIMDMFSECYDVIEMGHGVGCIVLEEDAEEYANKLKEGGV